MNRLTSSESLAQARLIVFSSLRGLRKETELLL
jgi:hypothetical protein